ncbi:MAG: ATP-binding protein, partial [Candidatus Gastranaerophilales bacterium]|nr:ATP-binding protein [Candidatus Gastranaerophilales bacterium]
VEDMLNITGVQFLEKHKEIETNVTAKENYIRIRDNMPQYNLEEIKTLRVEASKLDNLISQTGELLIRGIKIREHIIELSKVNSKFLKLNSYSKEILNYLKYIERKGYFNAEKDDKTAVFYKRIQGYYTKNAEIINEISSDYENIYNIIQEDDNQLNQTTAEIEKIAKNIRVLPLATLFHSFPRMIRDIAKENNKKINFIVTGSDTTVDKKIIEEIKMPLIHILRNSISHGIETPENRLKNNKPETGVIKLEAKQIENYIVITIEDDGYGIDIEKIKQIALNKNLLLSDEIESMNNEQIMKLVFLPGFSTEESVTEISGRGVGLDIVKTKITNLNGDIFIDSVLNKGCKIGIRLPISMSAIKVFILVINNQKYALPISFVRLVKQIKKEEIYKRNGINYIIYDGHSIPVYRLSEVFCESCNNTVQTSYTAIIIENQEYQAAYITDKLLGDMEVFQKKFVPPIIKIKNISGFTTLSTGEVCLIINPYELIRNTISNTYSAAM